MEDDTLSGNENYEIPYSCNLENNALIKEIIQK